MLWIGAAFCAAAVASFHFGLGRESEGISIAGRLEFDTVNPITIGHTAVTTVMAALCLASHDEPKGQKVWFFAACLPALVALVFSGARGPVVSLTVCIATLLIVTRHWRLLFMALLTGFVLLAQTENELARRFVALLEPTLEDESTLERIALIRNAVQQFVENPLLGGQLVDTEYFSYPHNLFLEALMAMGVVGTLALLAILMRSFLRSMHLLKQGELFIPLVLLQYFIAAQFSGAIWGWSAMWVPLASIISCGPLTRRASVSASPGPSPSF
jgi:O-antigen ligase